MFRKISHWFIRMNFDKKIQLFIFLAIGLTTLIILFASTISYIRLLSETSQSLISNQVNSMSGGIETALASYKNTSIALMLDDSIQQYLKYGDESINELYSKRIAVKQSLTNTLNMKSDMSFIAVVKHSLDDNLYTGTSTLTNSQFYDRYEEDFTSSRLAGYGTMRINFQSAYYNYDPYAVSIYQPIYDTSKINREIGLLCFSVQEPMLRQILDMQDTTLDFKLYLVGSDGRIVSSSDTETVGDVASFSAMLEGPSGTVNSNGDLLIYQRLKGWNFYLAATIPRRELYRDGMHTIMVLILAIIGMVCVSLVIGTRIVKYSYRSMKEVVTCMGQVSDGRLDVRMKESIPGDDFVKIARGFNHMALRLNDLVAQVKEEQHQIEQIRLNALQSQIQPHFLYNTLECIHWQAAMDGNKVISKIVKALASYYRLCLSKGRDIIELSQELQHIQSYITIQNVRYGDIITCDIQVDPAFQSVQIPKMTLQPLVENSIYHGIKVKDGNRGRIVISAAKEGEDILLTVVDNGSGMTQERIDEMNASISVYDEDFGYGVRNVHKRIELSFGKEYGLFYRASEGGGLTVDVRLPATRAEKEEEHVQGADC